MAAPALSVVGGAAMLWLALSSNDGLVADDYYKQGLAINQTLARERAAAASGLRAEITFSAGFDRVRVILTGASAPHALTLRLVHPTRPELDRTVMLNPSGAGIYEGALQRPSEGRWNVLLEDGLRTWRLAGAISAPGELRLQVGRQEAP